MTKKAICLTIAKFLVKTVIKSATKLTTANNVENPKELLLQEFKIMMLSSSLLRKEKLYVQFVMLKDIFQIFVLCLVANVPGLVTKRIIVNNVENVFSLATKQNNVKKIYHLIHNPKICLKSMH